MRLVICSISTFVLTICLTAISGAEAAYDSAKKDGSSTIMVGGFASSRPLVQDWRQYAARDEVKPKLQTPGRIVLESVKVPLTDVSPPPILLLTLQANNIQVREVWQVDNAANAFTVKNDGELYLTVVNNKAAIFVATVYLIDNFQALNTAYQNLTASAVITVEVMLGLLAAQPPRLEVAAGVAEEVYVFEASGGTMPHTYALRRDNPADAFVFSNGTLSVSANATIGEYRFTVEVADAAGMSVTVVATVSVVAAATIRAGGGMAVLSFQGQEKDIADGATVLFNPKSTYGVMVSAEGLATVAIEAPQNAWQITLYGGGEAYFSGVPDGGEIVVAVSLVGDSDSNAPVSLYYAFDGVVVPVVSQGRIFSRSYGGQWYLVIAEGAADVLGQGSPTNVNFLAFGDGRWNLNGVLEEKPFTLDDFMGTAAYRYTGEIGEIRANDGVAPSFSLVEDSAVFTVTMWSGLKSGQWLPGLLAIIEPQEGPLTLSVTVAAEDHLGDMLGNYGYVNRMATVTVKVEVEAPPLTLLESTLSLSPLMVTASGGYMPYTYNIITGNEGNYFDLDAHSGGLRFSGSLGMGTYSLTVQVSDDRSNTDDGLVVVKVTVSRLAANFQVQSQSTILISDADGKIFLEEGKTGIIGNVFISSEDLSGITYALINNPNNAFILNNGFLSLEQAQSEGQGPLHVIMEVSNDIQYVRVAITINIGIAGLEVVRDTFYAGLGDVGLVGRIETSGTGGVTLVGNQNNAFELDNKDLLLVKEQDLAVSLEAVVRVSVGSDFLDLTVAVQVRTPAEEMLFAMGGFAEASSFEEDSNGRQRQWLGDILVSPDGNGEDWITLRADVPFSERAYFGEVVHNGRIYILGGWTYNGRRNSEIWSSADGLTWQLEVTNPGFGPDGIGGLVALSHNGSIYVIGGDEYKSGGYQNDVWSSADGKEWMLVTDNAEFAERAYFSGMVHNGTMFVFGGQYYDAEEDSYIFYNDVWASTDGASWMKLSSPFGQGTCCQAAVSYNGKIVVMGGNYENTGRRSSAVWSSVDGINWELVSNGAMLGRHGHSAAVYNGKIFVMGNRYYVDGPPTQREVVQSSADGGKTWVTHDNWWNYSDTGDNSPWRRSYGGAVAFTPNVSMPPVDESLPLSGVVEVVRDTFYTGLGDVGLVGRIKVSGGEGATQFFLTRNDNGAFSVDANGLISLKDEQTSEGSLRAELNVTKGGILAESLILAVTVQVRAPAEEMIFAMGGRRESPSFAEDDRGRQRQRLSDVLVSPDGNGEDWLTLIAQAPFGARDHFGEVVHHGRIYVIAGWAEGNRDDEVWSSDDGLTWRLETNTPGFTYEDSRAAFSALSHNGSIYVIAGWQQKDVWSSADGKKWMMVTDDAGFAERSSYAAVVHNGVMFVIGGEYYDAEEDSYIFYNDVWASADGAKWTMLSSPFGEGIFHAKAVSYQGKIIMMGGNSQSGPSSSVWSSADGIQWELVSDKKMLTRHDHSAVVYGDKIFVMGNNYRADGPLTQRRVVESSSDGGKTWVTRDKWWDYSDTGDNSPWRRSYGGAVAFSPNYSTSEIGGPLSGAVEVVRDTFYTGLGDAGLVGKIKANGGGTTQYTFSLLSGDDFQVDSDGLVFLSQEQTSTGVLNAVVRVSGGSESLDLAVTVQVRAPAEEMLFAMGGFRRSPSLGYDEDGDEVTQIFSDILVSPDGNGEDWLTLTVQAPFGEKSDFGAVIHNGRIIIVGGWSHNGQRNNEIWSSADGLNWRLDTTSEFGFSGRGVLSALSHEGSIYVILDGYNNNDVWASSDGIQWDLVTLNAGFPKRSTSGAVSHNGTMFVIGGDYYPERIHYSDVWASTDGANWTQLSTAPFFGEGIVLPEAVLYDNKIFVLGGYYDSGESSAVWSSADGINWALVSDREMMRRHDHSAVVYNGKIFVLGNRYYADGPLTQRRVVESSSDGGKTWVTRDKWWDYSDTGDNSPWRRSNGRVVAF